MVQWNNPDRSLRRGPDGRRRFRSAGWRSQFCQHAGATGNGAARFARRIWRAHRRRHSQSRPAADARRVQHQPQRDQGDDHFPRGRPRGSARAALYPRRLQPFAQRHRSVRQYSAIQSAENAGRCRCTGSRRRGCSGARRRSVLCYARSRCAAATRSHRRSGVTRGGSCCRAVGHQFHRRRRDALYGRWLAGQWSIGLRGNGRRQGARSLRGIRDAHRAGERHDAGQDRGPGQRGSKRETDHRQEG